MGIPTDGEILLRAIIANPDDDAPRLAFADHLRGIGKDRHAEFIETQIAHPYRNYQMLAGERFDETIAEFFPDVYPDLLQIIRLCKDNLGHYLIHDFSDVPTCEEAIKLYVNFRRGFIERIHCTTKEWERVGERVVAKAPMIQHVAISDGPGILVEMLLDGGVSARIPMANRPLVNQAMNDRVLGTAIGFYLRGSTKRHKRSTGCYKEWAARWPSVEFSFRTEQDD